jgi:molybdopterin molybdotransferase
VTVFRRPRAAALSTGTELVEAGAAVSGGHIYDSNGPMLASLLSPLAESVSCLGVVGDEQDVLETALREGLSRDVLVVSGGVSRGDYDLVVPALVSLGVKEVFHECAIKPGKPTFFGTRGRTLVFGMPGNPLACFVVFHVLVRPAIARMTGLGDAGLVLESGLMAEGFDHKPGRRAFVPCTVEMQGGKRLLHRTRSHGSADIVGAVGAQALVSLPADCARVGEGDVVQFLPV